MRTLICRVLPFLGCLLVAACSTTRPLPKYQKPLARTAVQSVRTTAYTDTESDHVAYSNHNALGGTLLSGPIKSAAADWSRWPAGTVFRIRETGELYRVDDYGWALAGTNTIDLYKPSRSAMNAWGVRRVTIENLQWGDPKRSMAVLRPRSKYAHIRRMIAGLEDRRNEWAQPAPVVGPDPTMMMASDVPVPVAVPAGAQLAGVPVVRAIPIASTAPVAQPVRRGQITRDPFYVNSFR